MTSAESVESVEPHREAIAVDPPTKEAQQLWQKLGELAAEHREDLFRLLTFVHDPRALADAEALTKSERKWLRAIEADMAFDDAALLELFSDTQVERARQAFALLT